MFTVRLSQVNSIATFSRHMRLLILVALGLCFAAPEVSVRALGGAATPGTGGTQSVYLNTQVLVAPYYSVKADLKATLMISNQGPNEMPVQIRLFGRSGASFDLPPLTLVAHEVRPLDLGQSVPQG